MGEVPTALGGAVLAADSWYHGLQATLRKQFSHGLTTQVAYTYSKGESNSTRVNHETDATAGCAGTSIERRPRLIVKYNYDMPTAGRKEVAGTMLKGWSVYGVTTIQR